MSKITKKEVPFGQAAARRLYKDFINACGEKLISEYDYEEVYFWKRWPVRAL